MRPGRGGDAPEDVDLGLVLGEAADEAGHDGGVLEGEVDNLLRVVLEVVEVKVDIEGCGGGALCV